MKWWGVVRMDQIQGGSLGFVVEADGHLGSLRIAAVAVAAEHTGSGTHLNIADKAVGSPLGTLAVVQNSQMAEKAACQSFVGQVAPNHKT